jgi:N-acetylneuraminic acid mutarotase
LGFLLPTSEIYDVHTGAWTQADDMNHERGGHVAVGLPHHQVLVVGGALGPTAEIFTAAPRR